ncbi:MAG: hypothetical protein Q8O67_05845 [Deltaproteobacteria bacterium]|nr:hypothetical protein [Deltaproteobacteria bacterium]
MTASAPKIQLPGVADDDDGARVSRFELERYVVGELSPERRAIIERALATDPALQATHDDVVAADKAFLIELPPAPFFAKHEKAPSLWSRLVSHWQAGIGAVAAAAAVVVVVVVANPEEGNRTKGGDEQPRLSFFVKEESAVRVGHAGEELRAGDQIQLAVKDVDRKAMVVAGVDGAGRVAIYVFESMQGVVLKGNAPARVLPASLVLDDTTGPERFFLVYGDDLNALVEDVDVAIHKLAIEVKAGRADLVHTERLAIEGPQSSIHIVKVK